MSDTKEKHATHTPGPWQIDDCTPGESTGLRFEVGTKDSVIARTTDGWKEANANARLIAAAPEMYEQCKLFERSIVELVKRARNCAYAEQTVSDLEELGIDKDKLRGVLAKVEGGEG